MRKLHKYYCYKCHNIFKEKEAKLITVDCNICNKSIGCVRDDHPFFPNKKEYELIKNERDTVEKKTYDEYIK